MRHISWFSCGAASAIATKMMIEKYPATLVVRIPIANEDEDNDRFADDCAEWFGRPIVEVVSAKYKDCWQVWEERRFLNSPAGALCTTELKKKVRQAFQRPGDVQCFGYHKDEKDRAKNIVDNNPELYGCSYFPLIESNLSKEDCFRLVHQAGLKLPRSYEMGLSNANCIGCVKGGMGYWNHIRKIKPEVFDRMAKLERRIGASCLRDVYLDELDPERGRHESIAIAGCGFLCEVKPVQLSLFETVDR